MSETAKARARIKLPRDAVELVLVNDGYSVFMADTPVEPDGADEPYVLEIEGIIELDETLMPGQADAGGKVNEDGKAYMLRGTMVPTAVNLDVIG